MSSVSICIATYGNSEWQVMAEERALPSAYAQEPLEVLTFHDPDGTIASARNELGNTARGEWLCFLDADDELAPNYIQEMLKASRRKILHDPETMKRLNHAILMPAVRYIDKGRARATMMERIKDLRVDNFLVIGTLVERSLFTEVGGFNDYPHGFEDWSLWAKCWKAGAEIVQVPKAVYIAHINRNSEHRQRWRDREWQVDMHNKVRAELFG